MSVLGMCDAADNRLLITSILPIRMTCIMKCKDLFNTVIGKVIKFKVFST